MEKTAMEAAAAYTRRLRADIAEGTGRMALAIDDHDGGRIRWSRHPRLGCSPPTTRRACSSRRQPHATPPPLVRCSLTAAACVHPRVGKRDRGERGGKEGEGRERWRDRGKVMRRTRL